MPFLSPRTFIPSGNDGETQSSRRSSRSSRRNSSSIKHALSSILGGNNTTSARSRRGSSTAAAPMGLPLAAPFNIPRRVSYSHEDLQSTRNGRTSIDSTTEQNDEGDDYADIEDEAGLSDVENYSPQNSLKMRPRFSIPASSSISGHNYVLNYLSERGFLQPRVLSSTTDATMFLATSGDSVFLPTISSSDDEYINHLNGLDNEDVTLERSETHAGEAESAPTNDSTVSNSTVASEIPFDSDGSNVPFNLAVVLSFKKPTSLAKVKAQLYSRACIYWYNGLPPSRVLHEEYYTVGEINWELTNSNYNLYAPLSLSSENPIIQKQESITPTTLFKNKRPDELMEQEYLERRKSKQNFLNSFDNDESQLFSAGEYVFILPVYFTNHIPETIYLPSGRVNYNFRCAWKLAPDLRNNSDNLSDLSSAVTVATVSDDQSSDSSPHFNKLFKKVKNHLHISSTSTSSVDSSNVISGDSSIRVVRTPPLRSISTADKPIYINRVWTDSLSYEISFAQKYVSLGSEVPIKIKLVPLVKQLSIKRVRVSVVEKITFVSKNLEYEFDQVEVIMHDPYNPYFAEFISRRKQERALPLLEVRTRDKGCKALKEEIVENTHSDNLLCYSSVKDSDSGSNNDIIEPVTIETKLKFPTYSVLDKKTSKNLPPYGVDEFVPQTSSTQTSNASGSRHNSTASGVIGFLSNRRPSSSRSRHNSTDAQTSSANAVAPSCTSFRTSAGVAVQHHTKHNEVKRGLYMDSVNFSNIHVKHKLEIMLRISKDYKSPSKQRHYEVLIDTPLVLVSEFCNSGNMELPTYDMATKMTTAPSYSEMAPPSFEEALSVSASPMASPITSPMGSPNLAASYDVDDLSIQQLSLSRTTTQNASVSESPQQQVNKGRRYSNIDDLMSVQDNDLQNRLRQNTNMPDLVDTEPSAPMPKLFREGFNVGNDAQVPGSSSENAVLTDDEPPKYDELVPLMSDGE